MAVGSTSNWSAFYSQWFIIQAYPLVNNHITNWRNHHGFMGKSTISMAILNSFLYVYQRVWLRRWAPGASDFFTGLWKTMVHLVSDDVGIHKSSTLKISHGICKYRDISWYLMISHDISYFQKGSKGSSSNAIVFLAICRAPGNHP